MFTHSDPIFLGSFWSHSVCNSLTHILCSSDPQPTLDVHCCDAIFLQPPPFLKGWSSIPLSGSMQPGRPLTIHRYTSGTSGTGTKRGAFYWQHEVGTVKDGHWDGKIGGTNSIFWACWHLNIAKCWIRTTKSLLLPVASSEAEEGKSDPIEIDLLARPTRKDPRFQGNTSLSLKFKVWLGGFNAPDEDILPTHRICLLSSKQVVTLS